MNHSLSEYIAAIEREQAKRQSTYPKIIEKMKKRGSTDRSIKNELSRQSLQNSRLAAVCSILKENLFSIDAHSASEYLAELKRELKMRESVYKRLILFKRITPEAAAEQMSVWRSLVDYFNQTYLHEQNPTF